MKFGHDFGMVPFGTHQIAAWRERAEADERAIAEEWAVCPCGDAADCDHCD